MSRAVKLARQRFGGHGDHQRAPSPALGKGEIDILSGGQRGDGEALRDNCSMMESVLVPMEPVEPRMQMCFNAS